MQKPLSPPERDLDADPGTGLSRLFGVSDSIYAFAMTLLAVNVNLPQLAARANSEQVTNAVIDLIPELFIYVSSFVLVALYWQVSRRVTRIIAREDIQITWFVLMQLMFVAFLPVATGLFDTHSSVPIVVVVYASTLLGIGIAGQLVVLHAVRANLIDPDVDPHLVRYYKFRGYVTISIYTLLLLAGVVVPVYARLVLLALFLYPFLQRLYKKWHRMPQGH